MVLLRPTVTWTTRQGRTSSTTSGYTRIYLIRLQMSPVGLSVSWSWFKLIPDDLDNFHGWLNQPPRKPRTRYTRTFYIVVTFHLWKDEGLSFNNERFLLFSSRSYVPPVKNWSKQGSKSGEEWIYGYGRADDRIKKNMRLYVTFLSSEWHASGSCPTKFDWVSVNIVYVFPPAYWSFSLRNLNFLYTTPPFPPRETADDSIRPGTNCSDKTNWKFLVPGNVSHDFQTFARTDK
jgi:hypothetical protein